MISWACVSLFENVKPYMKMDIGITFDILNEVIKISVLHQIFVSKRKSERTRKMSAKYIAINETCMNEKDI